MISNIKKNKPQPPGGEGMKIKPCPFCGKQPTLSISNSRDNYVYVMCQNDDCLANIGHNSADDAIRAWNKRIIDKQCRGSYSTNY